MDLSTCWESLMGWSSFRYHIIHPSTHPSHQLVTPCWLITWSKISRHSMFKTFFIANEITAKMRLHTVARATQDKVEKMFSVRWPTTTKQIQTVYCHSWRLTKSHYNTTSWQAQNVTSNELIPEHFILHFSPHRSSPRRWQRRERLPTRATSWALHSVCVVAIQADNMTGKASSAKWKILKKKTSRV